MPASVARNRWGQIFTNAEHAATKVEVVHYNRPLPSSTCLRGAMRQHEPRNNNPHNATPVPPPAKGKSAHRWLTATTTLSLLLFAVQGLSLSSWSSEQWLVSHLGRLVRINILFMNKALTWHFSFPEGQQHGNHTSSVIQ